MVHPSFRTLFLLFFGLLTAAMAGLHGQSSAAATEARAVLVSADSAQIQFQLDSTAATQSADGTINVAGLEERIGIEGAPALPFYSTYVALPPEATVNVSIDERGVSRQSVEQVRPVGQVDPAVDVDFTQVRSLEEVGIVYLPDVTIYEADALYPAQSFTVSEPMYMRDLRVVQVSLFPVRYNPVTNELVETDLMTVDIEFDGANLANRNPLRSTNLDSIKLINPAQAAGWRSMPQNVGAPSDFPANRDTFRFEINEDGIYEVTVGTMVNAGMSPGAAISSLEMSYRGESVAFDVIESNNNGTFDGGDKIRFFGWKYDGDRSERMFVENNFFYLWANGARDAAQQVANGSSGTVVDTWRSEVTFEEDLMFYQTDTNQWGNANFENPADAWYWQAMAGATPETFNLTLPNPVTTGANVEVLVEIISRIDRVNAVTFNYTGKFSLNGHTSASRSWNGRRNVNVTQSGIPQSVLNANGSNSIEIITTVEPATTVNIAALNRVTVAYDRELKAVNDALLFDYAAGNHRFQLSNLTDNDVIVWDVSDRLQPVVITLGSGDVSGSAGNYTATIGRNSTAPKQIIVATGSSVRQPDSITKYNGASLEPNGGSADWVVITHSSMMASANKLAAHRASYSGLKTHVVDINDVYQQYGYGFESPAAIKAFLAHGLADWGLNYVVLLGDATYNPLLRSCTGSGFCPASWNTTDQTYVITDLVFEDRFTGLIPSDFPFTLLSGNDLLPDLAIGRITSIAPYTNGNGQQVNEADNFVSKIIDYEQDVATKASYLNNLTWAADDTDGGGNFCAANAIAQAEITGTPFSNTVYCLDEAQFQNQPDPEQAMGIAISNSVSNGTAILNYRGHGEIEGWGGGIIDVNTVFTNLDKPFVILSADCLDGNFALPGKNAMSEEFLNRKLFGTAAHWSSSGLGFLTEHDILQSAFYEGLYDTDLFTIGDAVGYSKIVFNNTAGQDDSELYAFILQGDPAMKIPHAAPSYDIYLPLTVRQ